MFKKVFCLHFLALSNFFFDTVFPAVEKTLSAAVDVAETHNMDLASLLMLGNLGSFISITQIHLVLLPGGLSCKYMSISPLVSSGQANNRCYFTW